MKQVVAQTFMLLATVVAFTACDKGGGGGNGNAGGAQVAAIPGLPQGPIYAQGDQRYYCNVAGGSMSCSGINYQNVACTTNTISFTDINTMCTQLTQIQQTQCNVNTAIQQVQTQYCNSLNQNGLGNLNQPIGSAGSKTIQCEFEAVRVENRHGFDIYSGTPKITGTFSIMGNLRQDIQLSGRVLRFLDRGHFGNTKVTFVPAGFGSSSDTLIVSNTCLNDNLTLSQSGYAGQPVRMEAMNDDGSMRLAVSCAGQSGNFVKNTTTAYSRYACRGRSSLYGAIGEKVNVAFPYNSTLFNTPLRLAENLTATVTGDAGGIDNAQISITAERIGTNVSLVTSAYLKTQSKLSGTDGAASVDLVCGPE